MSRMFSNHPHRLRPVCQIRFPPSREPLHFRLNPFTSCLSGLDDFDQLDGCSFMHFQWYSNLNAGLNVLKIRPDGARARPEIYSQSGQTNRKATNKLKNLRPRHGFTFFECDPEAPASPIDSENANFQSNFVRPPQTLQARL